MSSTEVKGCKQKQKVGTRWMTDSLLGAFQLLIFQFPQTLESPPLQAPAIKALLLSFSSPHYEKWMELSASS